MAPDRRTRLLVIAGAAVAIAAVTYQMWPRPSAAEAPASNGRGAAQATSSPGGRAPAQMVQAPDVHLAELDAERPKPGQASRNLFRFKPKPTPPPAPPPSSVAPPVPTGPPPPPPPPPITLKFIGFVEENGKKIAALSDSAGHVDYGKEGEIIQGRYRILRIGVESIEMAYLDGSGRRTIRLGGG